MKYLPLIWHGLWRKPARTTLVALSLIVGFPLFGILDGADSAFGVAIQRQRLPAIRAGTQPIAHAMRKA